RTSNRGSRQRAGGVSIPRSDCPHRGIRRPRSGDAYASAAPILNRMDQGGNGSTPAVSVIIPARNEAAHIGRCVRSVLAQDVSGGLEVLVADGHSTDGTAQLARAAGAHVVDNPGGITPAGLNRALAAARGAVV